MTTPRMRAGRPHLLGVFLALISPSISLFSVSLATQNRPYSSCMRKTIHCSGSNLHFFSPYICTNTYAENHRVWESTTDTDSSTHYKLDSWCAWCFACSQLACFQILIHTLMSNFLLCGKKKVSSNGICHTHTQAPFGCGAHLAYPRLFSPDKWSPCSLFLQTHFSGSLLPLGELYWLQDAECTLSPFQRGKVGG